MDQTHTIESSHVGLVICDQKRRRKAEDTDEDQPNFDMIMEDLSSPKNGLTAGPVAQARPSS